MFKSFQPKDDSGTTPQGGGRNAERDLHGEKCTNDKHASTTDPEARLFRKVAGKEAKLCFLGRLTTENRHGLIVEIGLTEATGTAEPEAALAMIGDTARKGATVGADKLHDQAGFVAGCRALVAWLFTLTADAYNLMRIPMLLAAA